MTQAAPVPTPAVPTLTAVTPSSGVTDGGTVVTIAGTNLPAVTGVRFGGVAPAYCRLIRNAVHRPAAVGRPAG
ncbi:MAG: IPT/TIG domain-containing protein [Acidobacteria bacterium]|nr:IPT/TIG domain-containing protein [Acidobacteriota bacterium]